MISGIREWVKQATSKLEANSIVIFGSTARREALPYSDVDILIISKKFKKMKTEDRIRLILETWNINKPVHPICLTPEEAEKMTNKPLMWEICRKPEILTDDGTFKKIRHKTLKYLKTNKIIRKKYWYTTNKEKKHL